MVRSAVAVAVLTFVPSLLAAQNEGALRKALEGRLVAPRLDLPATTGGLDVYPARRTAVDQAELARDVARNGVGAPAGRALAITRIKVKGKHIELQLGKGGERQEPSFSSPYVSKSRAEKQLEDDIEKEKDAQAKKRLKDRLRDMQESREREKDRLEALKRIEHELKLSQHTPEEWALMAGSRFNVRFDSDVPREAVTPDGLRSLLDGWLDFDPAPGSERGTPLAAPAELRKGMPEAEVELSFGKPRSCEDSSAGGLAVRSCEWALAEGRLEAQFVDGVLVKYSFSSR